MKLQDIMSTADDRFSPEDALSRVVEVMFRKARSCAVICRDGKPVGVIAADNLLRFLAASPSFTDLSSISAVAAMTPDPLTANADCDLVDALQMLRSRRQNCLPVVDVYGLLAGIVTLENLVDAHLKQGAAALSQPVESAQHWLSLEDTLTGLANRRAMEIDLRQTEAAAKRRNESYAMAVVNVDYLKQLVEMQGRDAGDKALAHIAFIIRQRIRASDKAFRLGGDEFVYLMPGTPAAGAMIAAEHLRGDIEASAFANPASPIGVLTVSVGVASRQAGSWQELLKLAQHAMYKAVDTGRNKTVAANNLETQ